MTPRILYIASHCPFGESYGAQLRTLQIGRLLQRIGPVTMVLASAGRWQSEAIEKTASEFDLQVVTQAVPDPIRGVGSRLRHEIDQRYLNTHGHVVPSNDAKRVLDLAAMHDVVWIHTIRVANFFRRWRWERSVIDVDDLYSQYHETAAKQASSPLARLMSSRRAWLWRRRERDLFNRFNLVSVCSENDRAQLLLPDRVRVIPNGFADPSVIQRTSDSMSLGVVGRLDYLPNHAGVAWFLKEVWPSVRRKLPNAEFRIVGAGADGAWGKIDGVRVLGYVDDVGAEIADWAAMVVPLHIGAGTRVKIAEAFSRSCPVISTTIGAFGYAVKSGRELLLADSPADFADACVKLIESNDERLRLSQAGRSYFMNYLHWDALAPEVEAAVNGVRRMTSTR